MERAIAATAGVREAAVLLVRDRAGERVYAFIAGDATAVPRHPARVVTLESLPHRADGAVDREALRRMVSVD
jgi:acyl-coenzyme A synthetase/AMP-(fatty) acid ligase